MSDSPRYLVAKYIGDLQRMEPRNIGVVVWTERGVSARFAGERIGKSKDVDGRTIPSFVASTAAYKQWVQYWRDQLVRVSRKLRGTEWCDELKQSGKGNFCLTDGGTILEDIRPRDLPHLTDHLYASLVDPYSAEEPSDPALDDVADHFIRELGLTENKCFYSKYQIACSVAPNVNEQFEFSHAIKNGKLQRLFQRVPLSRRRGALRRTVHDSAWMFEKVVQNGIIAHDQAVALVYATAEYKSDPDISWSFDVLNSVARVANLADPKDALSVFAFE